MTKSWENIADIRIFSLSQGSIYAMFFKIHMYHVYYLWKSIPLWLLLLICQNIVLIPRKNHCGYFYWWLFCWSSASLISTFSAISTFRLVTFHRSATFCLNISTTVIFLSWWIHQLRENCYHRIKASLFHDKYWFTTVVFHSIKIDFVCRHRCWEKKNCD